MPGLWLLIEYSQMNVKRTKLFQFCLELYRSQDASTATMVRPAAPNNPLAWNVTEALLGFLEAVPLVVAAN